MGLKPKECFHTPSYVVGYVDKGLDEASRNLHNYQRGYVLPDENRSKLRKVLYNSWEVTSFNGNEEQLVKLAEITSQLGVELFVIDDGWFGTRNSDQAELGDRVVNPDKFPNGLHGLIRKVNASLLCNIGI